MTNAKTLREQQIDAQVTRMLQSAEESTGPDDMDYVDLMRAIAVEAKRRADEFITNQECDNCGASGEDVELCFVETGYKGARGRRWSCVDCAGHHEPMTRKEIQRLMFDVRADGNAEHDGWSIELDESLAYVRDFGTCDDDHVRISVYCTPDFESRGGKGTIEICVVDDGGDVLESDSIDWSFEGRNSRDFFAAVRPYLDAYSRMGLKMIEDGRTCDACPTVGPNTSTAVDVCPGCKCPAHATESDDDGYHLGCRPVDADTAIALNPSGGAL